MSIIDLAYYKRHLNITDDADNALITGKAATAEAFVGSYIGKPLSEFPPEELPDPIFEACLQLCAHLFENREAAIVGNGLQLTENSPGVFDLLAPYREYVF